MRVKKSIYMNDLFEEIADVWRRELVRIEQNQTFKSNPLHLRALEQVKRAMKSFEAAIQENISNRTCYLRLVQTCENLQALELLTEGIGYSFDVMDQISEIQKKSGLYVNNEETTPVQIIVGLLKEIEEWEPFLRDGADVTKAEMKEIQTCLGDLNERIQKMQGVWEFSSSLEVVDTTKTPAK